MKEDIEQIEKNKTWTLVPRLEDKNVIGTKWLYRNKLDKNGEVTRNKARLVWKGCAQEEGIEYGETFSLIARLEGVRTLFAYFAYKGFKVYQMDVGRIFLMKKFTQGSKNSNTSTTVDQKGYDQYIKACPDTSLCTYILGFFCI